jgi:hypothetical protein
LGVSAIVWVACERDARTPTPRHIDACALVTESDASELFGRPAARKPAVPGECVWSHDAADRSSWSLRITLKDITRSDEPVIVVAKTELTINGVPDPDPAVVRDIPLGLAGGILEASNSQGVGVHWLHGERTNRYSVELRFMSRGPSAPLPTTKIDPMEQLAQKVASRQWPAW